MQGENPTEEEDEEDVEIVEEDGLIAEKGDMVGQDEKVESSFAESQND